MAQHTKAIQEVNFKCGNLHRLRGFGRIRRANLYLGERRLNSYQIIICASAAVIASIVVGASYHGSGTLETKALLIVAGIAAAAAVFYTILADK